MKNKLIKPLLTFTLLIALLVVNVRPVFAAEGNSITFLYTEFIKGKGIVFLFEVSGNYDSFTGSVTIAGQNFPLSCKFKEDGRLFCSISGAGVGFAGQFAQGSLNGYAFGGKIGADTNCYPVYDYSYADNDIWEKIGRYCQDVPVSEGDQIDFYNGFIWNGTYTYTYMTPSWLSCVDFGDAFYYDGCG